MESLSKVSREPDSGSDSQPTLYSADIRLTDPETSQRAGTRGGRDPRRGADSRGGTAHGPSQCCPSCGASLPPGLGGGQLGRTPSVSSVISSLFSPGSSMRGGTAHGSTHGSTRVGSLLDLALLSRDGGARPLTHQYEAVGDEAEPEGDEEAPTPPPEAAAAGDVIFGSRPPGVVLTSFTHPTQGEPATIVSSAAGVDVSREPDAATWARVAAAGAAPPPAGEPPPEGKPPPPGRLWQFLEKAKGIPGKRPPPRHTLVEALWSFVGALIGITALAALDQYVAPELDTLLLTASFGASAVLVYSAPASPLAQPFNLVLGTMMSSLVGVITRVAFQGKVTFLAAGTSVAAAIFVMGVTGTTHPPGGAISLIAVIGGKRVYEMGFWYVLFPGTVGPLLLLFVAIVVNNLNPQRSYPLWWRPT